jgi:hypothetical protein
MKVSLESSALVAPSEESMVGNTNNRITDATLLTSEPAPPQAARTRTPRRPYPFPLRS